MEITEYYLKPNVVIEPLVDNWYAWSHLIPPVTYGLNIIKRHVEIMNSYILAPNLHMEAVKNPRFLGGPFIDYESDRCEEIKDLLENTLKKREKLISFSNAISELDDLLLNEAKGYSMEPLYDKIPTILKGYVELIYDLHNNPSFKFFESLLYKSEFYDKNSQSIALWLTSNDERPFCLSTPRIDSPDVLSLNVPFESEVIDKISMMRRKPASIQQITELLNIDSNSKFFNEFFTTEPLTNYKSYGGEKVRMRYFGHACVLLETSNISILVDPIISYYGYQTDVDRFSDVDLPDTIDYVLITHNHQDHILLETLLPLRHRIKNLVVPKTKAGSLQDPALSLMFKTIGFKNVVEIDDLESIEFHDCTITGVPFIGEHCDLDIRSKICHHIQIENFSLLFLADSCNIDTMLYHHVQREIGDVDVVFLGMECDGAPLSWLYGPLLNDRLERDKDYSRTISGSNYEQAQKLVNIFNPKELYVYAMGQEPWIKFISTKEYTDESTPIIESNKLLDECKSKGITAERLFGEKELFYDKKLKLHM
ncbi:MBL fold metallo-hydrolase [Aquimarina sp. AU474]|uniref:MBL fold metallo-hydrolase n=1 Tax=Aquimarina sp. AU474 TaxID=2108529 RepID=UPI000D685698|nr:MBL fold metallo-hydrolase [Aquimarina sp. AU474]